MGVLSKQQAEIIRAALKDGSFRAESVLERQRILRMHERGLVRRHETDMAVCTATDDGAAQLAAFDDVPVAVSEQAPAVIDTSGLVRMIEKARALFDDGDVAAASMLATGAYDQSKAAGGYAAKFGAAGKRLVAKAREMQGDALLIETRAKIRLAEEFDRAQADGRALKGRPKSISGENTFTQEEAGISAQEIHAARKLAAAEEREPGIVERAIAARLASGLEPTRTNMRHAVGTRSATKEERGDNLYETPVEAVLALLRLEQFGPFIWEPSCGRGAISRVLEASGFEVHISDLNDYGTVTADGVCQDVGNFLTSEASEGDVDIVTNPPYGDVLNAYVAHALRVHKPRKMALLLNVNFYGGSESDDRKFALDICPPARIYWFSRRLPMMHRDGWDGPKASSQMNTAWFVWERRADGSYGDQTVIRRVDWKDHQTAPLTQDTESEAA